MSKLRFRHHVIRPGDDVIDVHVSPSPLVQVPLCRTEWSSTVTTVVENVLKTRGNPVDPIDAARNPSYRLLSSCTISLVKAT